MGARGPDSDPMLHLSNNIVYTVQNSILAQEISLKLVLQFWFSFVAVDPIFRRNAQLLELLHLLEGLQRRARHLRPTRTSHLN